jgi:hypothetical protein
VPGTVGPENHRLLINSQCMRIVRALIACLIALPLFGQELELRVDGDQDAQSRAISNLAVRALATYQDRNRDTYLLNKFRLQVAAVR